MLDINLRLPHIGTNAQPHLWTLVPHTRGNTICTPCTHKRTKGEHFGISLWLSHTFVWTSTPVYICSHMHTPHTQRNIYIYIWRVREREREREGERERIGWSCSVTHGQYQKHTLKEERRECYINEHDYTHGFLHMSTHMTTLQQSRHF